MMGDAKRKRANRLDLPTITSSVWQPEVSAPRDAVGLVVASVITCPCARGGRTLLTAGRVDGEWTTEPCNHSFEITHWMALPRPPEAASTGHHVIGDAWGNA